MTLGDETKAYIERKKYGLHALASHIGKNLESEAKQKAPWQDRSANTRSAIHGGANKNKDGVVLYLAHGSRVGTFLEEGTGIYGPAKRPITPKNAKALKFTIGGKTIFVKSVKGMKARPIIEPTVDSNWPKIKQQVRRYWEST